MNSDTISYSGVLGPAGVVVDVGGVIQWESDGSVAEAGWMICLAPPIIPNPNVRLSDGPDPWIGRLEVNLVTPTDQWGTVCDDDFDDTAAGVVCSELGFGAGTLSTADRLGLNRAPSTTPILFDDVRCAGSESTVLDCDRASSHNVRMRSPTPP